MKNLILICASVIITLCLSSCIEINNKFEALPPGPWRGVLKLPANVSPASIEAIKTTEDQIVRRYIELPFNFDVEYLSQDAFQVVIKNGPEKIELRSIKYGVDRATAKDTLIIDFPAYDTYIRAIYEENFIEGAWHVNYKDNYSIPFIAYQGKVNRFNVPPTKPTIDVNGKWEVTFDYDKGEDAYPAIGIFKQDEDGHLTGTFKTETGDYRFLEGNVYGEKFNLSVFDGSHAFLFQAKQTGENEIVGTFFSGKHYTSNWIAKKASQKAKLTSPYELSKATQSESIDFAFPNSEGKQVSLTDDAFNGKPKLINIMGTWCPNCRDEVNFLKQHYDKIRSAGFEIISISFERYREVEKSLAAINRYKTHMEIPWPMLHGGYYNKSEATEKLPFIDKVISYPTLLLLDENNKIQKIHTGFNGPATEEYPAFEKEFFDLINTLKK